VNAIEARAEIDRARAHRIFRAAPFMTWQIGPTLQHLPGRRPVRPLALVGHLVDAAPGVAGGAYRDGIAQRLSGAEHEVEPALRRADYDGAGLLIGGIAHHPARD
jgi:hypothetical protein